jgi:hypothetical protein
MSSPISESLQEKEPQIVYCSRSSIENRTDEITLPGSLETGDEQSVSVFTLVDCGAERNFADFYFCNGIEMIRLPKRLILHDEFGLCFGFPVGFSSGFCYGYPECHSVSWIGSDNATLGWLHSTHHSTPRRRFRPRPLGLRLCQRPLEYCGTSVRVAVSIG